MPQNRRNGADRGLGPHRAALESFLTLADLPDGAAPLVASARSLADFVDAADVFDDKLWREFRLTCEALRKAQPEGAADGELAQVFELRAAVGDGEDAGS